MINMLSINLPEKILSSFKIPSSVRVFSLDVSCNPTVNDRDIINLLPKLMNLHKLTLNLDFCKGVTEDSVEGLVE